MAATSRIYAVLTGDIIGSSGMTPADLDRVRTGVMAAITREASDLPPLEFYRGDAWQLILQSPGEAFRTALYVSAFLKTHLNAATRISIGIGDIDEDYKDVTKLMTGEAFTLSGHGLDQMTRYFDLTLALPTRAGALAGWAQALVHMSSDTVRSWTKRQAQIVESALREPSATHQEIAAALDPPVKQQSVTSALQSANWRGLLEGLNQFEATDWQEVLGRDRTAIGK